MKYKARVCNFLTSNHCFRQKYLYINTASSSEIVVSCESGEKYAQIKQCLQVKTVKIFVQILMWEHNRWWKEALLWIMDCYLK